MTNKQAKTRVTQAEVSASVNRTENKMMLSEVANATCLVVNRRGVERVQYRHNSVNKEFSELFLKFFE